MFAVIEIGGKQYLVTQRQRLSVEKVDGAPGKTFSIERVLLVSDGKDSVVGQPNVDHARVEGKILKHYRGEKVTVLKYKPKVRYRRKYGHRQALTEIEITKISSGK